MYIPKMHHEEAVTLDHTGFHWADCVCFGISIYGMWKVSATLQDLYGRMTHHSAMFVRERGSEESCF